MNITIEGTQIVVQTASTKRNLKKIRRKGFLWEQARFEFFIAVGFMSQTPTHPSPAYVVVRISNIIIRKTTFIMSQVKQQQTQLSVGSALQACFFCWKWNDLYNIAEAEVEGVTIHQTKQQQPYEQQQQQHQLYSTTTASTNEVKSSNKAFVCELCPLLLGLLHTKRHALTHTYIIYTHIKT